MVQSRPFNFFYLASTSTVSTLSCGRFSQLFSHVERIYFSTPILKSFSWADGERQKVNVFANQGLMALSIFLHLIKFVVWAGGWAFRKYFLEKSLGLFFTLRQWKGASRHSSSERGMFWTHTENRRAQKSIKVSVYVWALNEH